jgi:hypothetical protein
MRQEVIKKVCPVLGEVVLGHVCNSAVTDISPAKSWPTKKGPDE